MDARWRVGPGFRVRVRAPALTDDNDPVSLSPHDNEASMTSNPSPPQLLPIRGGSHTHTSFWSSFQVEGTEAPDGIQSVHIGFRLIRRMTPLEHLASVGDR